MQYEDGATLPTSQTDVTNDGPAAEPVLTQEQLQKLHDDATAERTVVDPEEASDLDPADPNLAAAGGDNDHTNHIGDVSTEDLGVEAAGQQLDTEPIEPLNEQGNEEATGEDDTGDGA